MEQKKESVTPRYHYLQTFGDAIKSAFRYRPRITKRTLMTPPDFGHMWIR